MNFQAECLLLINWRCSHSKMVYMSERWWVLPAFLKRPVRSRLFTFFLAKTACYREVQGPVHKPMEEVVFSPSQSITVRELEWGRGVELSIFKVHKTGRRCSNNLLARLQSPFPFVIRSYLFHVCSVCITSRLWARVCRSHSLSGLFSYLSLWQQLPDHCPKFHRDAFKSTL